MTKSLFTINQWFRDAAELIVRARWLLIVLLIIIDVLGFWGITKVKTDDTWDSWFAEDDPINVATDEFEDIFGNNDYVGLLITADDVFQPKMLKMIRELGNDLLRQVPLATDVTSLADFEFALGTEEGLNIDNLVPDEIPTDPAAIEHIRKLAFSKQNLVNRLFTEDSKQTWIILRLREYPEDFSEKHDGHEGSAVIGKIVEDIIDSEKYEAFDIKHSGMPMVGYNKMEFFNKEGARIIGLALLAVFLVLIATMRSVRGVVVPLFITISAIVVTYGGMGFLGIAIDNALVTIPVYLGLAVSIGYSIHIFNFFNRRFSETGNRRESVLHAIEQTGWPLFFTALTTIGSLLSFNLSKIVSIQWVGNASASIISVAFLFVIVLTPALLSFGKNKAPKTVSTKDHLIWTDKLFNRWSEFILKYQKPILVVYILLILFLTVGLLKTRVDFDPIKTFGLKIPYVQEISEVGNSPIGAIYSYDVVVEFPEEGMAKLPENMRRLEALEEKIKALELTKRTSSILDIVKDMNRTLHSNDESYYQIPDNNNMAAQLLLMYEMSGGNETEKWMDYEYTRLRLMVEISMFKASEVEHEIEYVKSVAKDIFPESKVSMVGMLIQGAMLNNYIARGQISTTLFAIIVIGLLMMVVFRSIKTGLIGLIPNLTPVFVIGGIMGYLDIGMDMMSMTIIPMIMGIAVDDTIHFINHCKYETEQGLGYNEAITHTFRTVGKALLMTTFILVITFSMYTTSIAKIFEHMGYLIGAGFISALLADYTVTPILLKAVKSFGQKQAVTEEKDS